MLLLLRGRSGLPSTELDYTLNALLRCLDLYNLTCVLVVASTTQPNHNCAFLSWYQTHGLQPPKPYTHYKILHLKSTECSLWNGVSGPFAINPEFVLMQNHTIRFRRNLENVGIYRNRYALLHAFAQVA